MSDDYQTVDPDTSLEVFAHDQLLRSGRRCFLVSKDSRLVGLITPKEIREIDRKSWPSRRVGDVMRPADKIHFIPPDLPAIEALETMGREDVHQLPVLSDGRITGIVTRAHILQVLPSRSELADSPSRRRAA